MKTKQLLMPSICLELITPFGNNEKKMTNLGNLAAESWRPLLPNQWKNSAEKLNTLGYTNCRC